MESSAKGNDRLRSRAASGANRFPTRGFRHSCSSTTAIHSRQSKMSTESRRKERPHQSSLFMTETFIFGVFITVVAFTVPVFLANSWEGRKEGGK